jgi:hypothetical protein
MALIELGCFSVGLRSDDDLLAGFQIACRYKFAAIPNVVGKYFRTSDLAASSVLVNGRYGPDHFRSRILCFEAVIKSGRKQPWNMLYASEVRKLCKLLATQGESSRSLAMQQFKYGGLSAKGIAFLGAAMLGGNGIRTWSAIAALGRKLRPEKPQLAATNGLRKYFQSVAETTKQA